MRVLVLGALAVLTALAADARAEKFWVYIGTYNTPKSRGIYRAELDTATGKLSDAEPVADVGSPSFLAIAPDHKHLYAVLEQAQNVSAFAIDSNSGKLKLLNARPSRGGGPCHITIDQAGKNVLVANYGGGSAAVIPITKDGKLGPPSGYTKHPSGSNVVKDRQKDAHAHSINLDPNNRFAFVADLGTDKVHVYKFDGAMGTITPNKPEAVAMAPGAGPRHFAFHPSGKYAYVINEIDLTITALSYDADKGLLTPIHSISTVPADVKDRKGLSTAEVVVHPSGKFVYGSNRGHNTIAIFAVDEKTGKLTAVGHQGKDVKTPRNFNIDPTGKWLLVANQSGDSVVVFKIDEKTGALEPTEHKTAVGAPVCLRFMPAPK